MQNSYLLFFLLPDVNNNSVMSRRNNIAVVELVEGRNVRINNRNKTLPDLYIAQSRIPGAGRGLFAGQPIRRNAYITEYGGEVISQKQAEKRRAAGKHTHIKTIAMSTEHLDSRVTPKFPMEYYIDHHLVAGFANSSPSRTAALADFKKVDEGLVHPYGGVASGCIFLTANRDIRPGEEITVWSGRGTYSEMLCN